MSEKPRVYEVDFPELGRIANTMQRYRGVLIGWAAGDGAPLRAFVDALTRGERQSLDALQMDDYRPDGGPAVLALWNATPPRRFWNGCRPARVGRHYPTMISAPFREGVSP